MTEAAPLTATTDDGEELPIIQLLDIDGEETEDLDEAVIAVCQTDDGRLIAVEITSCEPVTLH